jgi:hypothetical protein
METGVSNYNFRVPSDFYKKKQMLIINKHLNRIYFNKRMVNYFISLVNEIEEASHLRLTKVRKSFVIHEPMFETNTHKLPVLYPPILEQTITPPQGEKSTRDTSGEDDGSATD